MESTEKYQNTPSAASLSQAGVPSASNDRTPSHMTLIKNISVWLNYILCGVALSILISGCNTRNSQIYRCGNGDDYYCEGVRRIPQGTDEFVCNNRITGRDTVLKSHLALEKRLKDYVVSKDARIGVAIIIDGVDTVSVNGNRDFPMLSVYKFPQALAVADYCGKNKIALDSLISINANEIKTDTWSPLRDKYGVGNLRLPLSELLRYSLQQSDNNACDILFRLIGGPQVADSLMKAEGFNDIVIASTEEDMHRDIYLCYQNRSTPLDMARLFDKFYRLGMRHDSPVFEAVGDLMLACNTGQNRLAKPFMATNVAIGHKTGTGDRNARGRIIGVNDAGYVFLPDKREYAIAVFVADSDYDMAETEKIIAEISEMVFKSL